MIRSFKHKGLKRLYERGDQSKINPQFISKVERYLSMLDVAESPDELALPGNGFHQLHGDLKDHYALKISGNWRLTFSFTDAPENVDLVDYH